LERKQTVVSLFLMILGTLGVLGGCSLYKKGSPTAPNFSKPPATPTPTWTPQFTAPLTATPPITPTFTSTPTPTPAATDTFTFTPTATFTACAAGFAASSYTFNSSVECWQYELTPAGVSPSHAWDGAVGAASPGSVSLHIPFSNVNQQVVYATSFGSTPANLANKRITLRFRVDSWRNLAGTADANINTYPGGAKIIVKTGSSWVYGSCQWQNITTTGSWQTLTLNVSSPYESNGGYDPTQVVQIGLELNTNSSIDADGFGTAIVHVDDVIVEDLFTPTPTATPGGAAGWTFDSGITPWSIETNGSTAAVAAASAIAWDGAVDVGGSSSSGSASLFAPFTTNNQDLLVANSFQSSPISLTGKAVTVRVRVDSCVGADLTNSPLLAQVVLKAGTDWTYGSGAWISLTSTGTWFNVTIPSVDAVYSSALSSQVIQAAVAFRTGSAGTYGNTVIHIDNWLYQ